MTKERVEEKEYDFQFVIVTHSSHLMNTANKGEELFMLNMPSQLRAGEQDYSQGYNQMVGMTAI